MTRSNGVMRWAANFAGLSAVLHVLALPISGFSTEAWQILPVGMLYAGFAYCVMKGSRWLSYLAFFGLMIGVSFAISHIWAVSDVPGWLYAGIASANLIAVAALFAGLWKAPDAISEAK